MGQKMTGGRRWEVHWGRSREWAACSKEPLLGKKTGEWPGEVEGSRQPSGQKPKKVTFLWRLGVPVV